VWLLRWLLCHLVVDGYFEFVVSSFLFVDDAVFFELVEDSSFIFAFLLGEPEVDEYVVDEFFAVYGALHFFFFDAFYDFFYVDGYGVHWPGEHGYHSSMRGIPLKNWAECIPSPMLCGLYCIHRYCYIVV